MFCKEWEIQCECVGKLVNHCCVAKTTEKKQRDNPGGPNMATLYSRSWYTNADLWGNINYKMIVDNYLRGASYLSGRVFNDLHQWDPC